MRTLSILLPLVLGLSHADAQCPTESFRLRSSGATGEFFGQGLDANAAADVILAGAPFNGLNGSMAGAAYIRRFDGTSWQEDLLLPSDGQADDTFGWVAALDGAGDTALIGSLSGTLGRQGAAYVFQFDGTAWAEQAKIVPNDPTYEVFGYLGLDISEDGTVALIISIDDMYVFRFDGAAWIQEHKFTNFAGVAKLDAAGETALLTANFGTHVSRHDGTSWSVPTMIVPFNGWRALDGAGTRMISGDFSQPNDCRILHFDGSSWIEELFVTLTDPVSSVDLNWAGDVAVIGLYEGGTGRGTVLRYRFDGSSWNLSEQLFPELNDTEFGRKVVLDASGVVTVTGAEHSPFRWPVYVQSCTPANTFCEGDGCPCGNDAFVHGCDNGATHGGVYLREQRFDPVGRTVELLATGFRSGGSPAALAVRANSQGSGALFGDGLLCLGAPLLRIKSGVARDGSLKLSLQHGAMAGTFHYQLWYRSSGGFCPPAQFNLSNGVSLTWQ